MQSDAIRHSTISGATAWQRVCTMKQILIQFEARHTCRKFNCKSNGRGNGVIINTIANGAHLSRSFIYALHRDI